MAKSNIVVKVFVDWDNQQIYTKGDLDDYRDQIADELKADGNFECWLDENFCASEVWDNADNIGDAWDEHIQEEVDERIEALDVIELMCYPNEYDIERPF